MKDLRKTNHEVLDELATLKQRIRELEISEAEHKKTEEAYRVFVAQREQAEAAIAKEREKLQTLFDNAPFGMVLIDTKGHFTYLNKKFTELFGYDLSDIPNGRTWFKKAYPERTYRHTAISTWIQDRRNISTGTSAPRVFNVTCRNEEQKVVNFITSALCSGDYLMTCEDVTEMRKLEAQLRQAQKTEAIGTLAGGIAHDFNNILTSLAGYAALIKAKMNTSDPLLPYVEEILAASQKATSLIQSLLAFSRQQPVTLITLDVNNAIKTTEQLLRRLLTENIELRVSLTGANTSVKADKSLMDQILFNLVTNARDAMPTGGILTIKTALVRIDKAFIRTHGFGETGEYVQMNVSDTGMGMDETTKGKIFDPFFTTKEVGKGTGLGLATVYGIVKQHNGFIAVESQRNRGTTFSIYFPAVTIKENEEGDTAAPISEGKETILIAEDDGAVRDLVREVLQTYGYRTIEAIDGEDAIRKFKQNRRVHLVVLDMIMPKKNGREVYEEIRSINPRIKVLFVSGYTRNVVFDKGIEDGELDFIAKPLSFDIFLQKIREILDR